MARRRRKSSNPWGGPSPTSYAAEPREIDGAWEGRRAVDTGPVDRPADVAAPVEAPRWVPPTPSPSVPAPIVQQAQELVAQPLRPHADGPPPVLRGAENAVAQPLRPHVDGPPPILRGAPPAQTGGNTTFGPGNDLRRTQINPTWAPQYAGQAAENIAQARVQGAGPIAGTNLTGARSLVNQARAAIAGNFRSVAGPDYGRARGDLDGARGDVGQATVADLTGVQAGTYAASPEARAARAAAMGFLSKLSGAPSRTDIAREKLDLFNERSRPAFEENLRLTGAANAALGRLGSGMVRDDLRDAVTRADRERGLVARELAAETAGLEHSDSLDRLGAGLGASTTFQGQDLSDANMNLTLRNEARGERDAVARRQSEQASLALARAAARNQLAGTEGSFASSEYGARANERDASQRFDFARSGALSGLAGLETDFARTARADAESDRGYETGVQGANAGLALQRSNALTGLDSVRFGRESSMRDEMRGERGRQDTLAQQAIQNRERQARMEEEFAGNDFSRQQDMIRTILGIGGFAGGGNAGSAYRDAAAQAAAGGQGQIDAAAQAAYLAAQRRRMQGGRRGGPVVRGVDDTSTAYGDFA